ncbi:MAG: cell envelope integrity protein TolA [Methylophaga sp.]|nr:cell envelope integrity protein TolA [Methylophaga sp.]
MKNRLFENISAGSFAIILHVALFALIFIGMDFQSTTQFAAQPKVDIVHATAMDEADVLAEMARQQELEDEKRQQEQDRQDEIDKKLEQTEQELEDKKQEIVEQQKQAELEQQQRELEAEQKQQEIAELEQQRKVEDEKRQQVLEEENKQRLQDEERKQKIAEDLKIAEEKKLLAEADAKAAQQKKRDAEEAARKAEEEETLRLAKIAEEKKKAEAKAEHDRIEKEKRIAKEKADAAAAKLKAEQDARELQMQESLATEAREQEATRVEGVVNKYVSIIRQRVKRYWIKPTSAEQGLQCTLQVSLFPGGDVKQVKVVKSSGNALFDHSAETAVYKAGPLPVPTDPKAAAKFKQFSFNFKPE